MEGNRDLDRSDLNMTWVGPGSDLHLTYILPTSEYFIYARPGNDSHLYDVTRRVDRPSNVQSDATNSALDHQTFDFCCVGRCNSQQENVISRSRRGRQFPAPSLPADQDRPEQQSRIHGSHEGSYSRTHEIGEISPVCRFANYCVQNLFLTQFTHPFVICFTIG